MKIKPFRIPTQVVLPGLVVQVRLLPTALMDGADGEWDYTPDGRATIRIAKGLPPARKRTTLLHELQHVMVDYLDQALKNHSKHFKL